MLAERQQYRKLVWAFTFALIFTCLFPVITHAATGTIDATDKYAYLLSDQDHALINFGATNSNVVVSDTSVTGYAWGESIGWINLAPTNTGVLNDGDGNLAGYAWGENVGWVNFNPTNGGVTIDSSGYFHGFAWTEKKGWINFNCSDDNSCTSSDHKVKTTWTSPVVVSPPQNPPGGCTSCDNTRPVITLKGDSPLIISAGDAFVDPGATATDAEDGDVSASIVTSGFVDVHTVGSYSVTYKVTDSDGLSAIPEVRLVFVKDPNETEPDVPNEQCSTLLVSDGSWNNAVPTYNKNSSWTSIDGATWVWSRAQVQNPKINETQVFTRNFTLTHVPTAATLGIAADNSYKLWINGVLVDSQPGEANYSISNIYNVLQYLNSGTNNIKVEVTNFGNSNAVGTSNPAGFILRLDISNDGCQSSTPDPEFTFPPLNPETPPSLDSCDVANSSWASGIVSFSQGKTKSGKAISADRSIASRALGIAQNDTSENSVSLGFGGTLIVKFNTLFDVKVGDSIKIYESSGVPKPSSGQYPERAKIYASKDGVTYILLGTVDTNTGPLSLENLDSVQYIKIVDVSDIYKFHGGADDGFDVDGVQIINCDDQIIVPGTIDPVVDTDTSEEDTTIVDTDTSEEATTTTDTDPAVPGTTTPDPASPTGPSTVGGPTEIHIGGIVIPVPSITIPAIPKIPFLPESNPVPRVVSDVASAVGLVFGGVAGAAALASAAGSGSGILFSIQIWSWLMGILGFRKKNKPWGTVYDSVTKQPLDPAYVVLKTLDGKEAGTSITDIDGRYGFLVQEGSYILEANKTNYIFPSERLKGRARDELYSNLYFGETISIEDTGTVITKDIPMDPIGFDWNEFAKKKKKLLRFYSRFDIWIAIIADTFFYFGLIVSLIAFYYTPEPYNTIILILYVVLFVARIFGLKMRTYGKVRDISTGDPLSFAIVRVFSANLGKEILHKSCDKYGRYFALVQKGRYYIRIDKKMSDNSYQSVYISQPFKVGNGIIRKTFKV